MSKSAAVVALACQIVKLRDAARMWKQTAMAHREQVELQAFAHERKLVEHRDSFGVRSAADQQIIEGLRADVEVLRNRLNSLGIQAAKQAGVALGMIEGEGLLGAAQRVVKERNGLLTQVQDQRAEIERLRNDERKAYQDGEALRAEVADLRGIVDMVHASLGIKRGDHIGKAIEALKSQSQDDLERRLDAVGIAVKSGLGSAPYLLSHETLCALLQQAEQAAELKAKLAETNAAFQERDLLRRMAVQESLETRGKLIESEKLLSQASAERIRVHGLLSALFRSPPNQNAGELPMWAVIKDLLHVGRTRAHELCLEFGRDPDEEVAGLVENGLCSVCDVMFCERCEELTHVPEGHSPECEHCKSQDTVGGEP